MADLIDITLLTPHRVLGSLHAKDARCVIHQGVAEDLIKRNIARKTNSKKTAKNEPTGADSKSDGGE
jgi:hypothetical protein|tara:strand:- start:64 stop:264 length:201 start_codon:yes stop_codon:yes gene_type:complete